MHQPLLTQPAFAEETLDECVSYQKLRIRNQMGVNDVVLVSLVLTLNRFYIVLLFPLLTLNK